MVDDIYSGTRPSTMVFPKPMRAVALASLLLFIFLIFQVLHKPQPIKEPRVVYPDMKTDPNLEGKPRGPRNF